MVASPTVLQMQPNAPHDSPFLLGEADLPAGFPPPGPVDEIILKQYPAYRAAVARPAEEAGSNTGKMDGLFWPLFNHIKKNDIPMTAPVEMRYALPAGPQPKDSEPLRLESMAFLYQQPDRGQLGTDGPVEVVDIPALTVLSIGVRGSYNDANFQEALAKLQAFISANAPHVRVVGPPRSFGYNSPMVPWFLRYSEVQVPVEIKTP